MKPLQLTIMTPHYYCTGSSDQSTLQSAAVTGMGLLNRHNRWHFTRLVTALQTNLRRQPAKRPRVGQFDEDLDGATPTKVVQNDVGAARSVSSQLSSGSCPSSGTPEVLGVSHDPETAGDASPLRSTTTYAQNGTSESPMALNNTSAIRNVSWNQTRHEAAARRRVEQFV